MIMTDDVIEIRKQSDLEEPQAAESEPKERSLTVSKLTEWLGLTVVGIKVFEDTDGRSSEQQEVDSEL
jgi:hypothetical protein